MMIVIPTWKVGEKGVDSHDKKRMRKVFDDGGFNCDGGRGVGMSRDVTMRAQCHVL